MKKLISMLMASVLCLSLVACGGVDKTAAQAAMDSVATVLTDTATLLEEKLETADVFAVEELANSLNAITQELTALKTELDSEDVTQERLDEIAQLTAEYEAQVKEIRAQTEQLPDAPVGTGLTDMNGNEVPMETLEALVAAYDTVSIPYNEIAIAVNENGWMADAQTAAEMEALGNVLGFIGEALTNDTTLLDGSDFDALISSLEAFLPELDGLAERVSVPYEG